MQGVSFADHPLGPFEASLINPVINSGHEACFRGRRCSISCFRWTEKYITVCTDGENFEIVSLIQVPPVAPGPYCPDAFRLEVVVDFYGALSYQSRWWRSR